ncbi:hypothetical protein DV738_g1867, partial [Chaetothyriales sp. CBS 135597]
MKPWVLQSRSGIQLTYDAPDGVNSAHVYPRRASNGSTVIVYGHETGLRIVWYAGRKFKPVTADATNNHGKSKSNGQGSHDVEMQTDIRLCYKIILSSQSPAQISQSESSHVLYCLLHPDWEVHHIAITFTDQQEDSVEDGNDDDQQDSAIPDPTWTFLVASTSDTAAGLLLVHQVPVHGKSISSSPQDIVLLRRERLRLPLSAAKLAFNPSLSPSEPRRKKILDSKWIMGGRSVLALLEDGEFGIWDVEAVGPSSSSTNKNPIKGQANVAGIVGASITRFAVTGRFPSLELSGNSKTSSGQTELAPATPHTRKVRARGLFGGSDDKGQVQHGDVSTIKGKISVSQLGGNTKSESAILSYNSNQVYIPSVTAFWHAAANSGKNFLKVGTYSGPVVLPTIAGANGLVNEIALLPSFPNQRAIDYQAKDIPNFLASTSTRLILFVQPLADGSSTEGAAAVSLSRELALQGLEESIAIDNGELDVDALDRILDQMESSRALVPAPTAAVGAGGSNKATPNFGRSVVAFEDEDVDMLSPTPVRFGTVGSWKPSATTATAASRRTTTNTTQRKLFS